MSMVRIQARDPPPLSEADRKTLAGLAALPDVATDCSNVPPLDDTFWQHAVPAQAREPLRHHREQAHGHIALTIPLPPATLARSRHAVRLRGEDCQHLIHEAPESWLERHQEPFPRDAHR